MDSKRRRRLMTIVPAALVLTLATLAMAPGPAVGKHGLGHPKVRWDLIQILGAGTTTTAIPGGTNFGVDADTGDTLELTGSGIVRPSDGDVTGGGTFVHMSDGTLFAEGFYVLTDLVSWERRPGTFPAPNDGVGHKAQASAGVLVVDVMLFPDGGSPLSGVLTIFCHFPDTPGPNDEGINLDVGSFHFTQAGGVTLFHVFR